MPTQRQAVLPRELIDREFWEPYIINGYRRTGTSLWECVKYMFVLHNDLVEFWTHFIPLWIWLYWLYCLSFRLDLAEPYWYPLLIMWTGSCFYALCSSAAHGFACWSKNTLELSGMVDYHGISLYTLGYGISFYYYECPLGHWLCEYKWWFIAPYMVLTINCTLLSCLSRFYWERQRYVIKVFAYTIPYLAIHIILFGRFYVCYTTNTQCLYGTLPLHLITMIIEFLGSFFFASKLPERLRPGGFDYFCHSHQFFHCFTAIATSLLLYMLYTDALERRSEAVHLTMPNLYTTLLPFVVVLIGGGLIIVVLYTLMKRKYIFSNRVSLKSKEN